MRIGFFVLEYPPFVRGGLGTYAQNICPQFVKQGHDVTVFTMNDGALQTREVMEGVEIHRPLLIDAADIFPALVTEDIRTLGPRVKSFEVTFIYNILSATKFCNDLIQKEGERFDVIAVHDWLSGIAGIIAKQNTRLPLVFHVHSTEWGRSGEKGVSKTIQHIEETTGRFATRIITVSYEMQNDLIRHGFDPSKIRVVWNGVNPEKYAPAKVDQTEVQELRQSYGITEKEKMILFVGRLFWEKGILELVQAMSIVVSKHPEAKLVIVGVGGLEGTILDLIQKLGLQQNVKTNFRFVPEQERILHYAACDIAAFPSKYEPFGIVSLEAMAMEKPVVVGASGTNGFKEQVIPSGPEQTGFHVDGNRQEDIARFGIIPALGLGEEAKEMGKRGRERVKKLFTWKKVVEQAISIYEEAISEKAQKGTK